MSLLRAGLSPAQLRRMGPAELTELSAQIRTFLVDKVSRRGGHLGPNLGVVELTIALHRVFDSPQDPIVFDTGHQAYVHKILTGRSDQFDDLRTRGGLSGYPSRQESEHDWVENSHASTSLAYADGLAKAFEVMGERGRTSVAVIGDGALTGGMAWEALNNIAAAKSRPLVIVLNDNGRSYAPTAGGMAEKLATFRTRPGYERALDSVKNTLPKAPIIGRPLYAVLHAFKRAAKDAMVPQSMFEDLGLKYIGPVDGHDIDALERALVRARDYRGPILVHCLTQKGRGYPPAENDDAEQMHSPPAFDPQTGRPTGASVTSWTSIFGSEMVRLGAANPRVAAITAAMSGPTGLDPFAKAFPDRFYDVGIAEQHALTSAAGMAMGGLHPVVALYATFLNRAFDQLLMDVALHKLGVTVVLDRSGVTGEDGPSHHGMWDMSLAALIPGLRLAAPRDAHSLTLAMEEAVQVNDAPTLIRYPKGAVPEPIPALRQVGGMDILAEPAPSQAGDRIDVLVVGVGSFAGLAVEVAGRLADQGIGVTVVDPRWVLPVPVALVELAASHNLVVTIEDGGRRGGVGAAVTDALRDSTVPVKVFGIPQEFLAAASRGFLLNDLGLTAQSVARSITETVASTSNSGNGMVKSATDDEAHHNAQERD